MLLPCKERYCDLKLSVRL